MRSAKSLAKHALDSALAPIGFKAVRLGAPETTKSEDFLPLNETLAIAERMGLSVGDYIDSVLNKIPGSTQETIDQMRRLGVFSDTVETVVEIGPGSGRYLERTIAACAPAEYEIYETSADWAGYLASHFAVRSQPTDGRTLKGTRDAWADLVQAHKVFPALTFVPTCSYWREMIRVIRPGGFAVFDIMTEVCVDREIVDAWIPAEAEDGIYPTIMPRAVAIDYFSGAGFDFSGSFTVPMGPGKTECFVFRKHSPN